MGVLRGLPLRAVVLSLIDAMRSNGNWVGFPHIKVGVYFLQNLTGVPLGYDFRFDEFGYPFHSYELDDDLTGMRANLYLKIKPRDPYGPSFMRGELSDRLLACCVKPVERFKPHTDFVAKFLGAKGAMELRLLAQALFVTLAERDQSDLDKRVVRVRNVLSYVDAVSAADALKTVDALLVEWRERGLSAGGYDGV